MEEKRKQVILEGLAQMHESIGQLRKAMDKGNVRLEELALAILTLQVEILKEQYSALQLERGMGQANRKPPDG